MRVRVRVRSFAVQQRREMETIQAKVRIFYMHTHICVFCALARELLSANKLACVRETDRVVWAGTQRASTPSAAGAVTLAHVEKGVLTLASVAWPTARNVCAFVCVQVSCVENEHGSQHARGVVSQAWAAGSLSLGCGWGWIRQQENQSQKKLQCLLKRWLRQAIVQGSSLSTAM